MMSKSTGILTSTDAIHCFKLFLFFTVVTIDITMKCVKQGDD